MKKFSVILLLMIGTFSQAQMIDFEEPDWQAAMDKARAEGKMLMVYVNTTWCEPCLEMEESIFQDPAIRDFYSENFINVPFDAEGFPGGEIAGRYGVFIYPAFLFVNTYGELVHKGCGFLDVDEFIALGEDALTEEKTLMYHQKQFAKGERSVDFLAGYSQILLQGCGDAQGFVKKFYKDLPQEQWVEEASWTMINLNVQDPYSDQFEFLMTYHDMFGLRYGRDTVDAKVYDVLLGQFIDIYEGADVTLFANQALQKIMSDLDFTGKSELMGMVNMQYAELVGDWPLYGTSVIQVVKEQNVTDADQLNEFAWKFYYYIENPEHLQQAIGWMESLLKQEKTATTLDTYASLLYKTGKQKEAIKWEKKALEKAEEDLEDLMHYQLQLEKFKLGGK